MEKYAKKVTIDEIKAKINKRDFEAAADAADTIDWSTVKDIQTLGMVSDLYKMLHLFEESRNVLQYAYERQKSKPIVKSMCELSIILGDLISAFRYFNEYKELAPKDSNRYILQYKLYKAQNISLEEQIEVLEALKEHDYTAKWAYELAELYHRAGLETQCVNECDELILWFVDGKYVIKAYELKSQHVKLTEQEIYKYELLRQAGGELNIEYSLREDEKKKEEPKELEIGSDVSPYSTLNLQAVVAEGLQGVLQPGTAIIPEEVLDRKREEVKEPKAPSNKLSYEEAVRKDEEAIAKKSADKEVMTEEDLLVTQMYNPVIPEAPVGQELEEEAEGSPIDDILGEASAAMAGGILKKDPEYVLNSDTDEIKPITGPISIKDKDLNPSDYSNTGVIESFHKGSNMDDILSQGYDGQISLVMPDEPVVEKQITGQISIDEVTTEWEQKKKENEAKLVADIKKQVKGETLKMLERFDKATQDSLLTKIEDAVISAALEEEKEKIKMGRPKEIKVADIAAMDQTGEIATKIVEQALAEDEAEKKAKNDKVIEETKVTEPEKETEEIPSFNVEEDFEELEEDKDEAEEGIEEIEEVEEVEDIGSEEPEDFSDYEDAESEEYEDDEENSEDVDEIEDDEEEGKVEKPKRPSYSRDDNGGVRRLTDSERQHFSAFIGHKSTQRQLANVLDNVTLASYTGNVLVSSEEEAEITTFSKLLIQEIAYSDDNFTGKVAIVDADKLNKKDIGEALDKVKNGALIITEPEKLVKKTVDSLVREMEKEGVGLVAIIQGKSDVLDKIVELNPKLGTLFNLRIDLKAFDNKTLVEYAKNYAYENEYAIDELGILALHQRISDMQTSDHDVTLNEVEEIMDEAIYYADKKTPSHFFDVLFRKRYDEEDMIILREKDFMHY